MVVLPRLKGSNITFAKTNPRHFEDSNQKETNLKGFPVSPQKKGGHKILWDRKTQVTFCTW